jgi:hypothetical protein
MTIFQAHRLFAARTDRRIGKDDLLSADELPAPELWPVIATAAAEMSGQLKSCRTDADLDAAVFEFGLRINRGEVTRQQFRAATLRVHTTLHGLDFNSESYPGN